MKRIIVKTLISLGILIALLAIYVTYLFMSSSTISKGQPIAQYENPVSALLVIDIQEGTTGTKSITEGYLQQAEVFINKVNEVIDWTDSSSMPVVYIYHENTNWLLNFATKNVMAEGSEGAKIDSRVKIISDNTFSKHKMDAFSNPALDEFLTKNRVDEIFAIGLDAAYCLNKTVFAAKNRNYKVSLIADAIISETDSKKNKMLEKFKAGGINIIQSDELIFPETDNIQ
ncbi:MAG: isochorismatase family cysteine hydrolase [Candidatus Zhuqueibacterota bacterium]